MSDRICHLDIERDLYRNFLILFDISCALYRVCVCMYVRTARWEARGTRYASCLRLPACAAFLFFIYIFTLNLTPGLSYFRRVTDSSAGSNEELARVTWSFAILVGSVTESLTAHIRVYKHHGFSPISVNIVEREREPRQFRNSEGEATN